MAFTESWNKPSGNVVKVGQTGSGQGVWYQVPAPQFPGPNPGGWSGVVGAPQGLQQQFQATRMPAAPWVNIPISPQRAFSPGVMSGAWRSFQGPAPSGYGQGLGYSSPVLFPSAGFGGQGERALDWLRQRGGF